MGPAAMDRTLVGTQQRRRRGAARGRASERVEVVQMGWIEGQALGTADGPGAGSRTNHALQCSPVVRHVAVGPQVENQRGSRGRASSGWMRREETMSVGWSSSASTSTSSAAASSESIA
jgi:hypothetical protein